MQAFYRLVTHHELVEKEWLAPTPSNPHVTKFQNNVNKNKELRNYSRTRSQRATLAFFFRSSDTQFVGSPLSSVQQETVHGWDVCWSGRSVEHSATSIFLQCAAFALPWPPYDDVRRTRAEDLKFDGNNLLLRSRYIW